MVGSFITLIAGAGDSQTSMAEAVGQAQADFEKCLDSTQQQFPGREINLGLLRTQGGTAVVQHVGTINAIHYWYTVVCEAYVEPAEEAQS